MKRWYWPKAPGTITACAARRADAFVLPSVQGAEAADRCELVASSGRVLRSTALRQSILVAFLLRRERVSSGDRKDLRAGSPAEIRNLFSDVLEAFLSLLSRHAVLLAENNKELPVAGQARQKRSFIFRQRTFVAADQQKGVGQGGIAPSSACSRG